MLILSTIKMFANYRETRKKKLNPCLIQSQDTQMGSQSHRSALDFICQSVWIELLYITQLHTFMCVAYHYRYS